jgi:TonB-dependent Receptor Plug Domain/CarboxypepD_reg-like domain
MYRSMKRIIVLILLLLACFDYLYAQESVSKEITLPKRELSLKELIEVIENQSPFRFAYESHTLPLQGKVKYEADKVTIEYALKIAANRLYLKYFVQDNVLILKKDNRTSSRAITIYGYVSDEQSGENLIQATVNERTAQKGTVSNYYGYYSLSLPADQPMNLVYSYVGYQPEVIEVMPLADTLINIKLKASVLDEVVVNASETEAIHEKVQMSSIDIPIQQIKSTPMLLGENDLLKAIQLLPGVKSGTEGSSGLYVRGGSPDQNLILLDGVPVYNVSHLFGFFSVFNSNAIKHVDLIKGGFPAHYGGRLSSVVDISMKEGNQKELHGEVSIGLIASKFTVEGPVIKGKSSFIVSGRRTYADLFLPYITKEIPKYHFYDLNAKFNHTFSSRDRLYVSAYTGNDRSSTKIESSYPYSLPGGDQVDLKNKNVSDMRWGNLTTALRWNHVYTPKLFSNVMLTYSKYQFKINNEYTSEHWNPILSTVGGRFVSNRYYSGIRDLAARIDFEYQPTANHNIRSGVYVINHLFSPGVFSVKTQDGDVQSEVTDISALESQVYVEDELSLGSKFKANVGVHHSSFHVREKWYSSIQPRLSGRYLLNDRLSVKASYASMAQFIHLLTNTGIGLPTDLWVPTTDRIQPQNCWQAATGAAYRMNNGFEFSVEGYYKKMNNVIEYKDGADVASPSRNWETEVESGKGWSYGAEVFIQKKAGKLNGWLGYTLAWSNRQFENINFGEKFPFRYDRRHDISIVANYKFSQRFELGSTFVYGTGVAITLPRASYVIETNTGNEVLVDHYTGRNQDRMPAYHRMDVSATWHKRKKRGNRAWIVSVYNVYNQKNPFIITSTYNESSGGTNQSTYWRGRHFSQTTLFPIIPSVSYQFTF